MATVRDTVNIRVNNINLPPDPIQVIGDTTSAMRSVSFTIHSDDPEGDPVRYHLLKPLTGATLDSITGEFVWKRAFGQSEYQRVTFIAFDGLSETRRDVMIYAAVTNTAPELQWREALCDTVSWDVTLKLTVADVEGDSVRIRGFCSTNGGLSLSGMTLSGDTLVRGTPQPNPAQATVIWHCHTDLPEKSLWPSAILLLVPVDQNSGQALRDTVCVLNLPCDWDQDGKIGLADFAALHAAWQAQDTTKNLGPYIVPTGEAIPNIAPTQDRKIDFEDLMAFAMLWDWAWSNGRIARIAHPLARTTGDGRGPIALRAAVGEHAVDLVLTERSEETAIGLSIALPPGVARVASLKHGPSLGPDAWWLSRTDTSAGIIETWIAGVSRQDSVFGRLHLPPAAGRSPLQIEAAYEIRNRQNAPIIGLLSEVVRLTQLPERWALGPVVPNPFNPTTTIRYDVPTSGRVCVEVFDLLGQQVAVLTDTYHEPGHHVIVWDGTDTSGHLVASGVYLVRLHTGEVQLVRRMALLR